MQIAKGTLKRALSALIKLERGKLLPLCRGSASHDFPPSTSATHPVQLELLPHNGAACEQLIQLGFPKSTRTRSGLSPPSLCLHSSEPMAAREPSDKLPQNEISLPARITDEDHPRGEGFVEYPFSAKAYYVGKEMRHRVKEMLENAVHLGFSRAWSKENPLVCLSDTAQLVEKAGVTGLPCETYIIAFDRMESVVFINGDGKEKQIWEELTDGHLSGKYTEEYKVSVMPDLEDSSLYADCIVLEQAEFNNIRTLAYVLAQTVALHFYETQVDRMLRKFEAMNVEMERSSSFRPAMRKEELLQMVAANNLLFTAIISKLGVRERFDVAWKNPDCNRVYEHLLEELEIEDRYENLQLKLNMVQDNFRYFLELIQNQKSDLLEWIIIILIGGEITLNLYELFMK